MTGDAQPPVQVYLMCAQCGATSIIDKSLLSKWMKSDRRCSHCNRPALFVISEKVYRELYELRLAAIPPTTKADIEESSKQIDKEVKLRPKKAKTSAAAPKSKPRTKTRGK